MTAPYRSPGARPRKPYAAPRLVVHYRLWLDPLWWLVALKWRLFGLVATELTCGPGGAKKRRFWWSERRALLSRAILMESCRHWPKPAWLRVARLAWRTLTGGSR